MNKNTDNLTPNTPSLTPDTPEKRQIRMARIYKDERLIPVTYQCVGCGGELEILEKTDVPIASITKWNICGECQMKKRGERNG